MNSCWLLLNACSIPMEKTIEAFSYTLVIWMNYINKFLTNLDSWNKPTFVIVYFFFDIATFALFMLVSGFLLLFSRICHQFSKRMWDVNSLANVTTQMIYIRDHFDTIYNDCWEDSVNSPLRWAKPSRLDLRQVCGIPNTWTGLRVKEILVYWCSAWSKLRKLRLYSHQGGKKKQQYRLFP